MITPERLDAALDRAEQRTRKRLQSGEFDPYTGQTASLVLGAAMWEEVNRALHEELLEQAGLPRGARLASVRLCDGTAALAVSRPNNGRVVR